MPVTDEEVAQRQEEILALRAERDQAKADAATAVQSRTNEISMAAMDAEEDQLRAEIEYYQNEAAKVDEAVEAQIEAVQAGISGEAVVHDDLDGMTKTQLQEVADSAGVTISSSMTKDEMIAAIRAGRE